MKMDRFHSRKKHFRTSSLLSSPVYFYLLIGIPTFLQNFQLVHAVPPAAPYGCHAEDKTCSIVESSTRKMATMRINYCHDERDKIKLFCNIQGDVDCITTACMSKSSSSGRGDERCRSIFERDSDSSRNHSMVVYGESCSPNEEKFVCCVPGSPQSALLTATTAESNEFPYLVKLSMITPVGDSNRQYFTDNCGGAIYNEKWIITAAHCAVNGNTHQVKETSWIDVVAGTNLPDIPQKPQRYRVKRIVVHEKYSDLQKNFDPSNPNEAMWDVALLELERPIQFSENVQAIKIASPDFIPNEFADKIIIAGWGLTNTNEGTYYLQKAVTPIRADCANNKKDQTFCVGGIVNGNFGSTGNKGDSGGPGVCRDRTGTPVLCGVNSYRTADDGPFYLQKVSKYVDWITKNARSQNSVPLFKQPIFGASARKELSQVKILSSDGKTCGGTLVSPDTVVTAAHCVFTEQGGLKSRLKINFGSKDYKAQSTALLSSNGKQGLTSKNDKFYNKVRRDEFTPMRIEEPYYGSSIALVKLTSKVSGAVPVTISKSRLRQNTDISEIAWMRNSSSSELRKFPSRVVDRSDCEERYNRYGSNKLPFSIDSTDTCMVEKFSGGNECDREIGGGVFCDAPDGNKLCGVQVFRMCVFNLPKLITDTSFLAEAIENFIKQ